MSVASRVDIYLAAPRLSKYQALATSTSVNSCLIIVDITETSFNNLFMTTYRLAECKQFIATNFFCIDNVIQTCIHHKFNREADIIT